MLSPPSSCVPCFPSHKGRRAQWKKHTHWWRSNKRSWLNSTTLLIHQAILSYPWLVFLAGRLVLALLTSRSTALSMMLCNKLLGMQWLKMTHILLSLGFHGSGVLAQHSSGSHKVIIKVSLPWMRSHWNSRFSSNLPWLLAEFISLQLQNSWCLVWGQQENLSDTFKAIMWSRTTQNNFPFD